jgi:chorismate mutase-like protein
MGEPLAKRGRGSVRPMRSLPELRAHLDNLDLRLVQLLAERLDVCREVARAKEKTNARVIAPTRVAEVWNSRRAWAAEHGVDPDFAEQLFRTLLSETHRIESAEAEGRPMIAAPASAPYESALQLAATRIDHVTVPVADLSAAERFLVDALGFEVRTRATTTIDGRETATVALEAGTAMVLLVEAPLPGVHVAIEVLDTEHARSDLLARGCVVGPTVAAANGVEQFFVATDGASGLTVSIVSRTGDREGVDGSLLGPGLTAIPGVSVSGISVSAVPAAANGASA